MGHKNNCWVLLSSITLALTALAPPAAAVLTEPDGRPAPIETTEIPPDRPDGLRLQQLFDGRQEQINWLTDVQSGPGVFSPLCTFSGTLMIHGGGCQMDFCWYNVIVGKTTPPTDAEIYTLIPKAATKTAFSPTALTPALYQTFISTTIRDDPKYLGGQIGFAIRGGDSQCPQTKYSENPLNTVCTTCTTPGPWISTVFYKSTVTPNAYYVGFEDLPMTPGGTGCDFDFNDMVFFVTGVTCDGAGQPCTVPDVKGVCALGRTDCAPAGGTPICRAVVKPTKETCDNIDNDCNGLIDDGDICPPSYVCDRGTCVPNCGTPEFPCEADLICSTKGYCVDPLCLTVDCPPEQVCKKGACVGKCDGIKCPGKEVCQNGKCIDLCDGVKCEDNTVCEQGVCIPTCSCSPCAKPKACLSTGYCVEDACKLVSCPEGWVCANGVCADTCAGAACPGGAKCDKGRCQESSQADSGADTGGPGTGGGPLFEGGIILPPSGGSAGAYSSGGASGIGVPGGAPATGGSAGGSAATFGPDRAAASSGCSCSVADRNGAGVLAALGGMLLVGAAARRRRRPRG
jgi:MYXO-CTERM domain-containing protein